MVYEQCKINDVVLGRGEDEAEMSIGSSTKVTIFCLKTRFLLLKTGF